MMRFCKATVNDCSLIRQIAIPTWEMAYSTIISPEQMAYMMEKMYSDASLTNQMDTHEFFFAYPETGESVHPLGFISINPKAADHYILEKLYVLPSAQKSGAGRFLIEKAQAHICTLHPDGEVLMELNVNRNNKAVGFYKHLGFRIDRIVNEDIGNGFYKNDYIMRKVLCAEASA